MNYMTTPSPLGELLLAADDAGLRLIGFPEGKGRVQPEAGWCAASNDVLARTAEQLAEYFAGTRREFDLLLAPHGTPFQLDVLAALQTIPYGATRSYADIARQIGRPAAVRAVGAANGRNPLPIVIPCHRVIGTSGKLVGFGGGLAAKRSLLDLEGGVQTSLAGMPSPDGGSSSSTRPSASLRSLNPA